MTTIHTSLTSMRIGLGNQSHYCWSIPNMQDNVNSGISSSLSHAPRPRGLDVGTERKKNQRTTGWYTTMPSNGSRSWATLAGTVGRSKRDSGTCDIGQRSSHSGLPNTRESITVEAWYDSYRDGSSAILSPPNPGIFSGNHWLWLFVTWLERKRQKEELRCHHLCLTLSFAYPELL